MYISLNRHALGAWNLRDVSSPSLNQWTGRSLARPRCSDGPLLTAMAPNSQRYPLVPSGVALGALIHARLEVTGQKIAHIDFLVDFIYWISGSDFLRFDLPEPTIGYSSTKYPAAVEVYGIKGQSVYTALFHHLDMETFSCRLCPHKVDDLEDAITHQRVDHFGHHPYLCVGTHSQWYVCFSPSLSRRLTNTTNKHISIQLVEIWKPSPAGGSPDRHWALDSEKRGVS
jgi:hypothetical protein